MKVFVNSKFAISPELYPCSNYGIWRFLPQSLSNTWEFYYPPVSYTGGFWTQGDPTVQTAHCALLSIVAPLLPHTRSLGVPRGPTSRLRPFGPYILKATQSAESAVSVFKVLRNKCVNRDDKISRQKCVKS